MTYSEYPSNGVLPSPGTSGNVLTSDGSQWTSAAPTGGSYPPTAAFQTNALYNDGSSVITIPDSPSLHFTGDWTVSMWASPINLGISNVVYFLTKGGTDINAGTFSLSVDTGYLAVRFAGNAGFNSPVKIPVYSWTYLSCTFNSSTNGFVLYQNGVIVATGTVAGVMNPQIGTPVSIFGLSDGGRWVTGTLREVNIWSVRRTQAQIQLDMLGSINPATAGLVAYYKMRDGWLSSTVADSTSNGNNGTIGANHVFVGAQIPPQ